MNATIKLKEALEILKSHYEKEYVGYENIIVNFDTESSHHCSYDAFDGFSEGYDTWELCVNISFEKKINNAVLKYKVFKSKYDIENDLKSELDELFENEENYVSYIWMSSSKTKELDMSQEVHIDFKKKNEMKLIKK